MSSPARAAILYLLLISLPGEAAAGSAGAIDMRTLSEKDITLVDVSKPGSAGRSFVAATIINAPIEKLCEVIQNYADYPRFMPNTEQATISQSTPTYSLVDMTLKLPMGKIKKYRLKMEHRTAPHSCVIAWKLVPWPGLKEEETIADTSGQWELMPVPSRPAQTMVKYAVYTDPGPVPFGLGFVVDSMSKDSIPKTLEALRSRVSNN